MYPQVVDRRYRVIKNMMRQRREENPASPCTVSVHEIVSRADWLFVGGGSTRSMSLNDAVGCRPGGSRWQPPHGKSGEERAEWAQGRTCRSLAGGLFSFRKRHRMSHNPGMSSAWTFGDGRQWCKGLLSFARGRTRGKCANGVCSTAPT